MALEHTDCLKKYVMISIPNEFINSIYTAAQVNGDSFLYGMRSNSLITNEATRLKFCLGKRQEDQRVLVPMIFNFSLNETDLIFKRHVNVVVDENIKDDTIVLSEELLFNLQKSSDQRLRIVSMNSIFLTIDTEASEFAPPSRASKVVVSLLQSQPSLEANVIDELLKRHFLFPIYLCKDDVFGIKIDKDYTWHLNNKLKSDIIYFKVDELQGPAVNNNVSTSKGYFVDNSVSMYQASNCQGFLPRRSISLCYKPNLHSTLSNQDIMKNILNHSHYLVPSSFNDIFDTLCKCMKPFFSLPKRLEGLGLSPIFLFTGSNGSGKSFLLQSASQFFGVRYWRVDCVNVGGAIPGQGESKLKTIFNQLKSIAPCILHLSNIEALCMDADYKEDVRVMCCLEEQLEALQLKWPVVIMATSQNVKSVSSSLHHLFLDSIELSVPNCEQRENIIFWFCQCISEDIDSEILRTIASQTSGFVFRDLEVLVRLASKERFKRSKEESEHTKFVLTDFTKVIGVMHKAFSESIGAPKVPSVLWKDVGGLEHLKKEILRSLRSNMFNSGLKRSGLLLHGPPGTGKTLLAKAVATQCGRNFLSVKGPELLNMYVGQSEHNVRDLFEMAKAASPCIIFFDELDSLAPNRGRSGDSGGVMDRVVSQLLAEMDHLSESDDVFILGATNRPDLIDSALLRPGRLDKLLFVGPCEDRSSQLGVLSALTHKLCLDQDVDLQEIVNLLPSSVTGAQLSAVCSAAWLSSARQLINSDADKTKTAVTVNRDNFISALREVYR